MKHKKVVLSSMLSLLLCFSLTAGGTFALFTSESKANVAINAGKVKVVASMKDLTVYSPTAIAENGDLVDDTNAAKDGKFANGGTAAIEGSTLKLENMTPGDEVTFSIVVSNESTVAAKYYTYLGVSADTGLYSGLDVEIDDGEGYTDFTYTRQTDWAMLEVNAEDIVLPVKVTLPTTAGNQYQGTSAELEFIVSAVQANAATTNVSFGDGEQGTLSEALNGMKAGEVITLTSGTYEITEDVKTNGTLEIKEGANVTLVLAEDSKIETNRSEAVDEPAVVNKGNLTIEGGSVSNNQGLAGKMNVPAIRNESGNLILKGCKIENVSPTTGGAYCVDVTGGSVTLINCTVKGNRGGISVSDEGQLHMIGGSVEATVYYPLYISGNGNSTFENVTFTKKNSSKGKALMYNLLKEDEGSVRFTNCTFTSELASATKFDISNNYTGLTFVGCTFVNVTDPNA